MPLASGLADVHLLLLDGAGCDACHHLGYKGSTGIFELWRLEESDYHRILRHHDEHRLRMHLLERGHRFLVHEIIAKLEQGITSMAEAKRVATEMILNSPETEFVAVG